MSRLDNTDALEKQLADLQMTNSLGKIKKIPPAVPPKKKAQPQVPHSAVVNTLREPSYSTKITPLQNVQNVIPPPPPPPPTYSNVPRHPSNIHPMHKDYANVTQLSLPSHSLRHNLTIPSKNYTMYSNVPQFQISNNPPPPPPPPFHAAPKSFDPNHNEELIPPPSPVSSNYSELMRATANLNFNQDRPPYPAIYQNEYPEYGVSQASTYESLYEPINLHPQTNSGQANNQSMSQSYKSNLRPMGKSPLPKEEEVDALTNMLVQSISDSTEFFGICVKCDQQVVDESSGCTAMGNMYHVKCFCCHRCNTNLQGKPFYAVDGNPYCEADYYETLEKCSVCNDPILDRILRATGKPYHPTCFTCVVCGKSLDGIPFTVDAMNQIHCIEDFHKKFAPRCCVCELPIMPEEGEEETVRVVALDRSFHVRCYKCEDCGLLLSSEAQGRGCYPLDDHILCKACNAHRIRLITNVMTTDL